MGPVKAAAQPRLLALFEQWVHLAAGHLGHEQFHGVGADIDDGAAL
jgi:hypothetical protein